MTLNRRTLMRAALASAAPALLPLAHAQEANWPQQPLKIIVPFTAGGAADVLTRRLAERLQAKLGQSVSVENRTGAGGNIGMEAVKNAAADGYTVASATIGTLSINQFLFAKLPYDPVADYAYVSRHWENCNVFLVAPGHPATNVQQFIEWARKKSGGVNYGSSGIGTTPHLAGALFGHRTGLSAVHVPFRGAAQSIPALLAGDTDFAIDNIGNYMPLIKADKVKALAITAENRWPTLPDVPTMGEAGVKDFIITSWGAIVLPKATPPAIVNRLSTAIHQIMQEPSTKEQWLQIGALAVSSSPADTAAFAERERGKWREVVRISGAKAE
jgi:tripartite-type tricarboxylate transporter receptor subunit TctC